MNEENKNDVIDLLQIFKALIKRWWIILLASLVCAGAFFGYTYLKITPMYRANAMMYVNNKMSIGSTSISISDLNTAAKLVDSYSIILKSRLTLEEVIKKADLKYTYSQLYDMVSVAAENGTEIFRITVKSSDPVEAAKICNTIVEVLPEKISGIIEGANVSVVDLAVVPASSYYPSY
ncbi:MAG: YveK family protein, partial [Eubacteriales bacterium]